MTDYTITRDNAADIHFAGELVGFASSNSARSLGRWTKLSIYRTDSDKLVLTEVAVSCHTGEHNFFKAEVLKGADFCPETVKRITEYFGYGWLAKELYQNTGIDTAAAEHI